MTTAAGASQLTAFVEVSVTELCQREDWLAANKDTAPVEDVRAAKREFVETLKQINKGLDRYNDYLICQLK